MDTQVSFESIYNDLIDTMKVVAKNQRISSRIIDAQYEKIVRDYPILVSDVSKQDTPLFDSYMSFYRWDTNAIIQYGEYHDTYYDYMQDIVYNHNKQYQWQLVLAFEAYEKYLKMVISYLVYLNNENHNKIQLKSSLFNKIKAEKYEAIYCDIKNNQKCSPNKILCELRNLYPGYNGHEKKNKRELDMRFMIALIERMRHHIVHTSGAVSDKNIFIKNILESIGVFNNGKYDKKYDDIVNEYFIMTKYPNEISLMEIPILDIGYIVAKTDVLDNLQQILLNSAFFIFEETRKYEKVY